MVFQQREFNQQANHQKVEQDVYHKDNTNPMNSIKHQTQTLGNSTERFVTQGEEYKSSSMFQDSISRLSKDRNASHKEHFESVNKHESSDEEAEDEAYLRK